MDFLGSTAGYLSSAWQIVLVGSIVGGAFVLGLTRSEDDSDDVARVGRKLGRAEEALSIALSDGQKAKALLDLGGRELGDGRWERARLAYSEARLLFSGEHDPIGEATALNDLGRVAQVERDHGGAEKHFRASLKLVASLEGAESVQGNALVGLAQAERVSGRFREAELKLNEALSLFDRGGDKAGRAMALVELGKATKANGDSESALSLFHSARDIFHSTGDALGEANALMAIGHANRRAGRSGLASQAYGKSCDLYERVGNDVSWADCLRASATLDGAHTPDEALLLLEQALKLSTKVSDDYGRGLCFRALGNLELKRGNWARAQDAFGAAVGVFSVNPDSENLKYVREALRFVSSKL